ncbi:MAG: CoA-binding protein, partial [Dehalococcoidia bacterium]
MLIPENYHYLDAAFHPKSIAVVGAHSGERKAGWISRLLDFGYEGSIYPINPNAIEISGLKTYPTIRDVPEPVDYAIFNVPAQLTPQIMTDCVVNGVKVVHMFTSGFSETGKEDAKKLELQVASIAKEGGVRIIGPNCMGIYYPAGGLTFAPFSKVPGNVSFISQSGAGSVRFIHLANERGIHFSKVISYGNAIDLDAPDFLEYLASDIETKIIACYIEGVKDGRRFLKAVKQCLVTKPVVILKAGLTESGARVTASHTASLAGSSYIWKAFFNQTRAISVDSLEECADMLMTLLFMPNPEGRRAGIVGRGGGLGVMATDSCEYAGLRVPPFLPETTSKLKTIIPDVGISVKNPVESARTISDAADFYNKGLEVVDADSQIDFTIIHIGVDVYGGRQPDLQEQLLKAVKAIANIAYNLRKPVAVVLYSGEYIESITAVHEARKKLVQLKIPVYFSIDSAAISISRNIKYHEYVKQYNPVKLSGV